MKRYGTKPLESFWLKSSQEQIATAPGLIAAYTNCALRYAKTASQVYPHEDVEPRVMYALAKAAYTYKPGKAAFIAWLRSKVRGEMSNIRQRCMRYNRDRIHFESINVHTVDEQVYYLD